MGRFRVNSVSSPSPRTDLIHLFLTLLKHLYSSHHCGSFWTAITDFFIKPLKFLVFFEFTLERIHFLVLNFNFYSALTTPLIAQIIGL